MLFGEPRLVRPASFAGTESGPLRVRAGQMENDILPPRPPRRARRPAVHARRPHRIIEGPIRRAVAPRPPPPPRPARRRAVHPRRPHRIIEGPTRRAVAPRHGIPTLLLARKNRHRYHHDLSLPPHSERSRTRAALRPLLSNSWWGRRFRLPRPSLIWIGRRGTLWVRLPHQSHLPAGFSGR